MKDSIILIVVGSLLMMPIGVMWLSAFGFMLIDMLQDKKDWLSTISMMFMFILGAALLWGGTHTL